MSDMKYKVLKEAALRELNEDSYDSYPEHVRPFTDLDVDVKDGVRKLVTDFFDGLYSLYSTDMNPNGRPSYSALEYAREEMKKAFKSYAASITSY